VMISFPYWIEFLLGSVEFIKLELNWINRNTLMNPCLKFQCPSDVADVQVVVRRFRVISSVDFGCDEFSY
jgi:hypothetical protein